LKKALAEIRRGVDRFGPEGTDRRKQSDQLISSAADAYAKGRVNEGAHLLQELSSMLE
jgi:hypothetical protein